MLPETMLDGDQEGWTSYPLALPLIFWETVTVTSLLGVPSRPGMSPLLLTQQGIHGLSALAGIK